jgi:hypothetical protein
MAQHKRSFCAAFFKKRPLFSLRKVRLPHRLQFCWLNRPLRTPLKYKKPPLPNDIMLKVDRIQKKPASSNGTKQTTFKGKKCPCRYQPP